MIYEKYPQWDIDVEKGTVYSLFWNKYVGHKNKKGYLIIKDENKNQLLIHRIIWECVNGHIPEGYDVHHIDKNKQNNSIYNLELINHKTHSHNHKIVEINFNKPRKKVGQYTLDGKLIKIWESIKETERNGFSQVGRCCKNIYKQHKGFIWRYIEEKDVA